MSLFLDAANAWNALQNINYTLDISRRGKLRKIEISFMNDDFPHIAGMQYARDVDFGLRKAEFYGANLIPALLSRRLDDRKIESSQNWSQISGRLMAIINLQNILDNDFIIVAFNKYKVDGHSKIDAKFAIKSLLSDTVYFLFLDQGTDQYYFRSAFQNSHIDYTKNQSAMTVLKKVKTINGSSTIIYRNSGYSSEKDKYV